MGLKWFCKPVFWKSLKWAFLKTLEGKKIGSRKPAIKFQNQTIYEDSKPRIGVIPLLYFLHSNPPWETEI